jgi:hypothetical protein
MPEHIHIRSLFQTAQHSTQRALGAVLRDRLEIQTQDLPELEVK